MARPCRLDGDTLACRLRVPVQVRSKTREALKHCRYMSATLLVNVRKSAGRADKAHRMSGALRPAAANHIVFTSGTHLFEPEPSLRPPVRLSCGSHRTIAGFDAAAAKWCLQELGEQRQRRQLFGTLAIVRLVAAVLARAPLGRAEATERRSCELDRLGCPCSQRVILPSLCVSCAPLLEAHGTLVGAILACVLRYARTCAAAVAALPLRRSRWIARPQTPLAAVDGSGNGDLHVCAV